MQIKQLLKQAEGLCVDRSVRMTAHRKQVLSIIAAAENPVGAYDILHELQQQLPGATPPTVYRALDFLLEQGFVHRLATKQSYLACDHPQDHHQSLFLICSDCGRVQEMQNDTIQKTLDHAVSQAGFRAEDEIVEITGRCGRCAGERK